MSDSAIVKWTQKFIEVTPEYDGSNFFTTVDGVRKATPLLLTVIVIELSDLIFAVDSIPAVFGVTTVCPEGELKSEMSLNELTVTFLVLDRILSLCIPATCVRS